MASRSGNIQRNHHGIRAVASAWKICGMPRNTVARRRIISNSTWRNGLMDLMMSTEAPMDSGASIATVSMKLWNIGNANTTRSLSTLPNTVPMLRMLATILACVSTAPLGRPVVPEV